MILLDTNVAIYASDASSPFSAWARHVIATGVSGDGAAMNAVALAELCVGDLEPDKVAVRIRGWGISILDVPSAASAPCAAAYVAYHALSTTVSA